MSRAERSRARNVKGAKLRTEEEELGFFGFLSHELRRYRELISRSLQSHGRKGLALGRLDGVAVGEGLKGRGLAEAEEDEGVKTFGYDGYCLALHGVVDVVVGL